MSRGRRDRDQFPYFEEFSTGVIPAPATDEFTADQQWSGTRGAPDEPAVDFFFDARITLIIRLAPGSTENSQLKDRRLQTFAIPPVTPPGGTAGPENRSRAQQQCRGTRGGDQRQAPENHGQDRDQRREQNTEDD